MNKKPIGLRKRCEDYIDGALFPSPGHSSLGIRFLLVGLCIGFLVRIGMLWFVDFRFDQGDAQYYMTAAHNLLDYHTYSGNLNSNPAPDFYRPPLYSFFLAFISGVFGENPLFFQLAQIAISLITALLVTRITALLFPAASPWVFGMMMISPFDAVYTGAALSETLTTFLLVAAAHSILTIAGIKRWLWGGIFLGLCVLTRDIYLPLVIFIAGCWIILGDRNKQFRFAESAVLIIATCLVILPWIMRNHHIAERYVSVSEGRLGASLWVGTWATSGAFTSGDSSNHRIYPAEAFRDQAEKEQVINALVMNSREGDHILRSVALQRIYDEPFAVLGTYFVRAPWLWIGSRFDIFKLNTAWFPFRSPAWITAKITLWGLNSAFILLGIAGMMLTLRQQHRVLVLLIPILYTAAIYFPLNSYESRYSQPVYPFLLVFAGIAAASLAGKLKSIIKNKSDGK